MGHCSAALRVILLFLSLDKDADAGVGATVAEGTFQSLPRWPVCRVALLGGTRWEEGPEYARGRQLKVCFVSALHEMLLIDSPAPSAFKKSF